MSSVYEFKILNYHFVTMIAGCIEMPDAMETIFQAALALGRHGGVSLFYLDIIQCALIVFICLIDWALSYSIYMR